MEIGYFQTLLNRVIREDLMEKMTLDKDLKDIRLSFRQIFGGKASQTKGTSKIPEAEVCLIPLESARRKWLQHSELVCKEETSHSNCYVENRPQGSRKEAGSPVRELLYQSSQVMVVPWTRVVAKMVLRNYEILDMFSGFINGLVMRQQRKGLKDDSQDFGLRIWKNRIPIY